MSLFFREAADLTLSLPVMALALGSRIIQEGQPMPIIAHNAEVAENLALAVIAASGSPMLLLGGDFTIIAASNAFCAAFHCDPADIKGQEIFNLGGWNIPQLRTLLSATSSGDVSIDKYEIDFEGGMLGSRRLVLKAEKLSYGDLQDVRLLLSVFDVTEIRNSERLKDLLLREKDELIRDKGILLQEMQHRIANSLQIIAGVLLSSARKVQSSETKGYLEDAHKRVIAIATVQQQLSVSASDNVQLGAYFKKLCQSLGASMIADTERLTLVSNVDDSTVSADASVTLGLIVTELVINSLKHAFPGDRAGTITIDYRSRRPDWTLMVSDDGIGMPKAPQTVVPGLGTSLVNALASSLAARVRKTDAYPGTQTAVIHGNAIEIPHVPHVPSPA